MCLVLHLFPAFSDHDLQPYLLVLAFYHNIAKHKITQLCNLKHRELTIADFKLHDN